jgi:hypothetical protein
MAELRSGLLWRMDARTPKAAAEEMEAAAKRFVERTGGKVTLIYTGLAAEGLVNSSFRLGLTPDVKPDDARTFLMADKNLPVWDMLLTGDEPVTP